MGDRQPATLPTQVEDAALPAGAKKPSAATAQELLADVSLRNAYAVASVIELHPRHKDVILAHIAAEVGNKMVNEVLAELKELTKSSSGWSDHVAASDEDDLASGKGGDAQGAAPDPAKLLPYNKKGGWNAVEINSKLGQADKIAGTDSDASRCAFAVALAGQIFGGPDAVANWLVEYLNAHKPTKAQMTPRKQAAWSTILRISSAVGGRTATYGDLSWAQEALHAFMVADDQGGASDASDVLVPELESFQALDGVEAGLDPATAAKADAANNGKVCHTPAGLFDEILALAPGQRLLIVLKVVTIATSELYAHQIMASNHDGTRYLYDPEKKSGSHMVEATEGSVGDLFAAGTSTIALVQGRVDPQAAPPPSKPKRK